MTVIRSIPVHDGPAAASMPACAGVRVVLADDDALVRGAVAALLSLVGGVTIVAEAHHGAELVSLVDQWLPDLVITDVSMPGMGGLEAIARIRVEHPQVRALVVSMLGTPEIVHDALRSGALGFVRKDAAAAELEPAVRRVMTGQEYLGPSATRALASRGLMALS